MNHSTSISDALRAPSSLNGLSGTAGTQAESPGSQVITARVEEAS